MDLRDTPAAGHYRTIYADPPWKFATRSDRGGGRAKSPSNHYAVETLEALARLPIAAIAAQNCWLFMWTTWPHLLQAIDLAASWSDPANPWRYRTGGTWAKQARHGPGFKGTPGWQFGTGYIFRSASEPLLVFGRGDPAWLSRSERNLWVAPIREHSRKPAETRRMLERATQGPRIELFGREAPGPEWDVWGMEAGKFGGRDA